MVVGYSPLYPTSPLLWYSQSFHLFIYLLHLPAVSALEGMRSRREMQAAQIHPIPSHARLAAWPLVCPSLEAAGLSVYRNGYFLWQVAVWEIGVADEACDACIRMLSFNKGDLHPKPPRYTGCRAGWRPRFIALIPIQIIFAIPDELADKKKNTLPPLLQSLRWMGTYVSVPVGFRIWYCLEGSHRCQCQGAREDWLTGFF